MKNFRLDFAFIILLLSLSIFAWRQLPELVIRGDGFVYMISSTLKEFFGRRYWYTGFETSAAVLGTILPKLYKTNIQLYFYTSLTLMMFINVLFYLLLRVITKHRIISFFGALLFGVNYFGNFDMYSQHCYCFVIERVVTAPFLLIAFLFLHIFLEKKRLKFYLTSLFFYFLGLGIGHFALLFTSPYILYPFFWKIFHGKKENYKKNFIQGSLIGLSFLTISTFIVLIQQIHESGQRPKSIIQYILHPEEHKYPEKIVRQFVYWSQYQPIIKNIGSSTYRNLSIKNAAEGIPYIIIIYAIVAILVYKNMPKERSLLFATVFGTVAIFFINAWFGQYDVLYQPGANRYLYFPTFLLALFWTLFLWMLWRSNVTFMKLIAVVLVLGYYLANAFLIYDTFKDVLSWDRSTKLIYIYMTSMRLRLKRNSLVVAPYPEVGVYESTFFTEQLGGNSIRFMSEYNTYSAGGTWEQIATSSAYVYRLRYDKNCGCVKEERLK